MPLSVSRRGLFATAAASLVAAGCGSNDDEDTQAVRIGWIIPLSGPYQAIGEEMRDGMQLYLDVHDNMLGGHRVSLITVDEGDGPDTAYPAAEKLVKSEQVSAIAGLLNGESYQEISEFAQQERIPLIGAGGRPDLEDSELQWLWHVSWVDSEHGKAIAPYIQQNVNGPVYVIGPDYQGGRDQLRGFTEAFTNAGGEIANPDGEATLTDFPGTEDFDSFLAEIAMLEPSAIYAYYAGSDAENFIEQYGQSDAGDIPLYGSFLTESQALHNLGSAAQGVRTVMNYSADLDNEANRAFVAEWQATFERLPNVYGMCAWDAAQVLDNALSA